MIRFSSLSRWALLLPFCLLSVAAAAKPIQSGLQPGEQIFSLFEPLNVTGPYAGEPHCLVCENGANPVAMVFARQLTPPLVRLLAKLDAAAVRHEKDDMGSFVVFLAEDEQLGDRLKAVAKQQSLKHTVLAMDPPAGPDGFKVAADAEVTVVLYREHTVKANHAFRSSELNDQAIEKILADLPKLFSK